MPAHVGDKLPDFALPLATREGYKSVFKLSEHLGRGDLMISFFPLAFTGVCTKQMCDIRDHYAEIEGAAARAFGFSVDAAPSNHGFILKHDLQQPIISDPNREVVHRIWETQTVLGVKDVAKRGILVLSPEGVVKHKWINDDPGVRPPYEEIARHLARAP